MKKKHLLYAGLAAAGIGALAVYSYLDVMYKETIPEGPAKKLQKLTDNGDLEELHQYTIKSNEWNDAQDVEVIDHVNIKGNALKGYLLPAENPSNVFVMFAHGYRSDHRGDPANFMRYYHEKGYNFFSCDHVASGNSQGNFVGFDYFESQDMLEWIDYLISRFGEDIKIILHGVSMGGATVCKMADKIPPQVKLIIADCPFTSAIDEFECVAADAGLKHTAPYAVKAFNALNKRLAGYDLNDTDVRYSVKNSRAPMLFVHGGSDTFVPTAMGKELYNLCNTEKDLFIVDKAKHAESIVQDTEGYLAKLDEFIPKYL
ncbi:MAG: alpha/beta hydrolase [Eubacterium sp.]|nr:alpha/beta hydrolase [Eubacterium sp.]